MVIVTSLKEVISDPSLGGAPSGLSGNKVVAYYGQNESVPANLFAALASFGGALALEPASSIGGVGNLPLAAAVHAALDPAHSACVVDGRAGAGSDSISCAGVTCKISRAGGFAQAFGGQGAKGRGAQKHVAEPVPDDPSNGAVYDDSYMSGEIDGHTLSMFCSLMPDGCVPSSVKDKERCARAVYRAMDGTFSDAEVVQKLESYVGSDASSCITGLREAGVYDELFAMVM